MGLGPRLDVWVPVSICEVEMRVDVTPEICCGDQKGDARKDSPSVRPGTEYMLRAREGPRSGADKGIPRARGVREGAGRRVSRGPSGPCREVRCADGFTRAGAGITAIIKFGITEINT